MFIASCFDRPRQRAARFVFGLAVFAALLAGCDQAPGVEPPGGDPPVLSGFEFSPHSVTLGDPDLEEDGDLVQFSVSMQVNVQDPDDDLERVSYVVTSPYSNRAPLAEGDLSAAGGLQYTHAAPVSVPRGEPGVYTVLIYAVDEAGSLSDNVRGMLTFNAHGEPPVIESVEADPEIVRPPTTLTLIATVSDPDGLGNIASVEGTTPTGASFLMFDDGTSLGDAIADDGRYTARFEVDSATPGTQTFTFVATDRTGLTSEVFSKDVVVE